MFFMGPIHHGSVRVCLVTSYKWEKPLKRRGPTNQGYSPLTICGSFSGINYATKGAFHMGLAGSMDWKESFSGN